LTLFFVDDCVFVTDMRLDLRVTAFFAGMV
jgi:hypothetical protein